MNQKYSRIKTSKMLPEAPFWNMIANQSVYWKNSSILRGFTRRSWHFCAHYIFQYVGHMYIKIPMYSWFWKFRTYFLMLWKTYSHGRFSGFFMEILTFWISVKNTLIWLIIYFSRIIKYVRSRTYRISGTLIVSISFLFIGLRCEYCI